MYILKKRTKEIICFLLVIVCLTGCGVSNEKKQVSEINALPPGKDVTPATKEVSYDASLTGVVKKVDTRQKLITIFDVETKFDRDYSYTGGTDVKNRYGTIVAMSQIPVGEIVDIDYKSEKNEIVKLYVSSSAWEYKGVNSLSINKSDKIMQIADRKYKYSESLLIVNDNQLISLMEVNKKDELMVKGIGSHIYSVTVTKGHGYIRLKNYKDFIGGYVQIGYDTMLPVTENMLIVVREGSYNLVMMKGDLKGDKAVLVEPNQEITVDMSEFQMPAERKGEVNFVISPAGATLTINDVIVSYEEPIEFNYGDYNIKVSLRGYKDFTGILTVGRPYQNIEIALMAEEDKKSSTSVNITIEGEDEDDSGSYTPPSSDRNNSNNNSNNTNSNTNKDTNSSSESDSTNEGSSSGGHDTDAGEDIGEEGDTNTDSGTNLVDTSGSSDSSTTTTKKEDPNHTLTIQAPVGAEVYIDGTYIGTAPVECKKYIGEITVTLCKDGYVNQSYSVEIIDNDEDTYYTFPDLTPSNG